MLNGQGSRSRSNRSSAGARAVLQGPASEIRTRYAHQDPRVPKRVPNLPALVGLARISRTATRTKPLILVDSGFLGQKYRDS